MTKMPEDEKAKMRPISLTDDEDRLLLEIGGGSRTGAVKELMELHRLLKKAKGASDPQEIKYKLAKMVEDYNSID
jgi:hypothetical protein